MLDWGLVRDQFLTPIDTLNGCLCSVVLHSGCNGLVKWLDVRLNSTTYNVAPYSNNMRDMRHQHFSRIERYSGMSCPSTSSQIQGMKRFRGRVMKRCSRGGKDKGGVFTEGCSLPARWGVGYSQYSQGAFIVDRSNSKGLRTAVISPLRVLDESNSSKTRFWDKIHALHHAFSGKGGGIVELKGAEGNVGATSAIQTASTLLDYLLHCLLNVAGNLGFGMHVTFDPFDCGHDQSNWPDPHFGLTFMAEVNTAVTPLAASTYRQNKAINKQKRLILVSPLVLGSVLKSKFNALYGQFLESHHPFKENLSTESRSGLLPYLYIYSDEILTSARGYSKRQSFGHLNVLPGAHNFVIKGSNLYNAQKKLNSTALFTGCEDIF
ncbi:uncharacterized protein LACBIDRAFT_331336 [Laccaria bicolor S238N-H82]|uniref:Predicted protein n=1 Tax=Laccaria bicolor (strain S238N-H82 / ATCC MYA-4686) TaxID=486041 RepID=B0DP65_LACBS|nr:uncharacterized protein LACBIDRAFT_331336 [Laccaria bicolor S238N-H82]EDR03559.1 predicted protein [Laccaria bicolor S238N-H82]|eukprot:XP_001885707.1 predicted protein [Laccaria bicolor S238N-H82]